MEYKIIEKKYDSGKSYYIVKVPGFLRWKPYGDNSEILSYYSVPCGGYCCIQFTSIEEAEDAINRNIEFIKHRNHDKVVKVICSN